jgi:ribosomal protein S14
MQNQKRKLRHIWYFPCIKCGKGRAQSHKKNKAVAGLCRNCLRLEVSENQATLFTDMEKLSTEN